MVLCAGTKTCQSFRANKGVSGIYMATFVGHNNERSYHRYKRCDSPPC